MGRHFLIRAQTQVPGLVHPRIGRASLGARTELDGLYKRNKKPVLSGLVRATTCTRSCLETGIRLAVYRQGRTFGFCVHDRQLNSCRNRRTRLSSSDSARLIHLTPGPRGVSREGRSKVKIDRPVRNCLYHPCLPVVGHGEPATSI
jgi:hypothetical protein